MFRLKIAMLIGGGVLAFWGFQEFRVSSGSSSEATQVDLATLERGKIPESRHLEIGEHFAIYAGLIYEYEQSKYASGEPKSGDKVTHCYYPIVSNEHPAIQAIASGSEDFEFNNFAMLVKTKRFKTFGSIPDDPITDQTSVKGLVVNTVDSLDSEEKRLLKTSFPQANFDSVMILQEGRAPASLFKSLGMLFGGLALSAVGLGSFFIGGGR